MTNTYTSITADDFSDNVTDRMRYTWTAEKVWWLAEAQKALPDVRFIVTTDRQTGHAEGPVTIEGVRQTPGYGTHQVLLRTASGQGTWHSLTKLGAVIALEDTTARGVKWEALSIRRDRREENPYWENAENMRQRDRAGHDRWKVGFRHARDFYFM